MANTRETMGEAACLDALVSDSLTSFEDDGISTITAKCLRYHTALTDVTMSKCRGVGDYGLAGCTNLEVVDILGNNTIASSAFSGDTKLKHLIMRGSTMTTLAHINALSDTLIANDEGCIYVKDSLLSTYKADSNWNCFLLYPLSEYPRTQFRNEITDSWAEIDAAADYATRYSIGDYKSIDLGTEGTHNFALVAIDADPLADGSGNARMTFVSDTMLTTPYSMNSPTATTEGGYGASAMRTYINDTIVPLIPSGVTAVAKPVTKYSCGYVSDTKVPNMETTETFWIPSYHEVRGGTAAETQGPTYYWLSCRQARRGKKRGNSSNTWWLRTAYNTSTSYYIAANASDNHAGTTSTYGVVLGFCI